MNATESISQIAPPEEVRGISVLQLCGLIAIGAVSLFAPATVSIIWLALVCLTIWTYTKDRPEWIWYMIAASPVLEVWSRMSKAPFVPYEIGKYYLLLAGLALLLYHVKKRSFPPVYTTGKWLLILLVPSLVVGLATFDREQWVFNALGIMEIGFLLLLAARERWDIYRFCRTIVFAIVPVICVVTYITGKTPGFSDMNFMLGANVENTGGFGTNQVSTILGASMVLTMLLLILDYPLFNYKILSFLLLLNLLLRGLLSFSRGGMIVAALAIIIAIVPAMFVSVRSFFNYMILIVVLGITGAAGFMTLNNLSNNKLWERYMGETEGSISGSKQKTWNSATSGRTELVSSDIEIFKEHPWFGVGPGGAKELRMKYGAIESAAAHTEETRLLSEHGVGGVFIVAVLLVFPFVWIRKQRIKKWKGIIAALFALAVFTSFHSAMRTNTAIVFYVLAAMPIMIDKIWIRKLTN